MLFALDPAHSVFTVQAFASGLLTGFGHRPIFTVREFTGNFRFESESIQAIKLDLTIPAISLTLTSNATPQDRTELETRMRNEVLQTDRFPNIVYQSEGGMLDKIADSWYRLRLIGQLHLRSVQRLHNMDLQVRLTNDEVRLNGDCTLQQSRFGIEPASALNGAIVLKDELRLEFDILGRLQPQ